MGIVTGQHQVWRVGEVKGLRKFLLVAGLALASWGLIAGQARADALFTQIDPDFTLAEVSQVFEPAYSDRNTDVADDFTIPTGDDWSIESVLVRSKHLGKVTTPDSFHITFYADNGGLPGSVVTESNSVNFLPYTSTSTMGDMTITFPSPVTLGPGKYWMSIEALMDSKNDEAPVGNAGRWAWGINKVGTDTSPAVLRNPGEGWGAEIPCQTYTPYADCNKPVFAGADQSFQLNGSTSPTPECTTATNAVATANSNLTKANKVLTKAKAALTKAQKVVKKAQSKLKSAKGKKAKTKAKKALKKAKQNATRATTSVKKAKKQVANTKSALNQAKTNQSSVC